MGHLPLETDGTLALSRLDEITKRYEENPRRFFAPLANAYRKAGELSRSISLCQRYLQDQPGNLHGQVVYGRALFDAGRLDEAGVIFGVALALDPEHLITLRQLGDIARLKHEAIEAIEWYKRVLDADPRNDEVLALVNELNAASAPVDQIVESPASSDLRVEVGLGLEIGGSADLDAQSDGAGSSPSESLAAHETPSVFVTATMAELYLKQGFRNKARQIYQQLAAINPSDASLRDCVRRLDRGDRSDRGDRGDRGDRSDRASPALEVATAASVAAEPVVRPQAAPSVLSFNQFFDRVGASGAAESASGAVPIAGSPSILPAEPTVPASPAEPTVPASPAEPTVPASPANYAPVNSWLTGVRGQ